MLAGLLLVTAASLAQVTRPVQVFETSAGAMKITPVQHASLMIEAGGQVIHLDPWSNGLYDGLASADLILITDIHGDHMDPKMLPKVAKPGSVILAPPAVAETIKRSVQPYFVLQGNICALLGTKDHLNVFLYDGAIVPDPEGIITGGHDNKTARTVAIREGEAINEPALLAMFRQIVANNRAGGWRKLKAAEREDA